MQRSCLREVNIVKVLRLGSMKDKRSLNNNKYVDIFFMLFILITVFLMPCSIIWVYHVRVLNAPKVYSDGFGYYVYLPALIYRDFTFGFVEGWEHPLTLISVGGGKA